MKKTICLILALALLLAFPAAQAEETEIRKISWEDVRLE